MALKTSLLLSAAIAVAASAIPAAHAAEDRSEAVSAPASPIEEELVRIRHIMSAQAKRLENAEQLLQQQSALLDRQNQRIVQLESALSVAQAHLSQRKPSLASREPARVHVVQIGETLYRIATNAGLTVDEMANANNIGPPYTIVPGQELTVPGGAPQPAMIVAATPLPTPAAAKIVSPVAPAPEPSAPQPERTAMAADRVRESDNDLPQEVGQRPDEEPEPYVALFSDVGGILTPKGSLFVEPEIDYTTSSDNRFFFQGTEIFDAILIGVIEATDTDRLALTSRLGARYGLSNRLEVEGRVSYVYRDDRVAGVALDDSTEFVRDLTGAGLGDIEAGLHYQLNDGVGFPYMIANLRAKAPTGKGPFEVDRTTSGVETELATGSGFWTVEPSLTFIYPVDPAVLFANIGYQSNLATSPDAPIGATVVRQFDPGDAIRASLGVGLAVNERLSLNFGYEQSRFFRTEAFIESPDPMAPGGIVMTRALQPSVTIGSFGIGGSFYLNNRIRLNLNTAFGATDEAPDMRLSLRAQIKLFD